MANMTVTAPESTNPRRPGRLNSITFTHTAAATGDGSVASQAITGTLLRVHTDNKGDDSWDLSFTASGAVIWEQTALGTGAQSLPICVGWDGLTPDGATDALAYGIPVLNETITCTTANMSATGGADGHEITIIYRED